jgi:hypothetical protein
MHAPWNPWLLAAHGVFYVLTGVWPLVHMPSFIAVTGPKTDLWLVRTVGVLVMVVGAFLLSLWSADPLPRQVALLATGCAIGLAAIDVIYVGLRRISKIYLLDALAELLLAALWLLAVFSANR